MNTFGEVVNFLRSETLRDTADPYLWSDESLCEFVAQAHDDFAEQVLHIRDSTSIAASFTLEAGVSEYMLNAVVLAVMTAKVEGSQSNLIRASASSLDGYVPPPDTVTWLENINYGAEKDGMPLAFTTDDSATGDGALTLRVWPTPTAAEDGLTVKLRVVRLPLIQCSMDTLDERMEIPRQYAHALVHGAAAKAYASQDADGGDSDRASGQQQMYNDFVTRAKLGIRRKLFQPLAWGFGRGGFTHSR